MRIALFGGSFDPPHKGHLLVSQTLVTENYVDEVWFVPCADHPFNKTMSPAPDRLAMLSHIPGLHISTFELDKIGKSYSIETLEHFALIRPNDSFSWVIGSDQLAHFNQWHRYEDILTNHGVLVYPRAGFLPEPLLKGMKLLERVPETDVSSTQVRRLVAQNRDITALVPVTVAKYITSKRLYT